MGKQNWKPGNMLNPVPAVMVSVADEEGKANIITVAWAGTVCTNPPMVSISVRPSRYSYDIIKRTGEFVINLTNEALVYACDYCGVVSGRDVNKFDAFSACERGQNGIYYITEGTNAFISVKVDKTVDLGSHTMFIGEVTDMETLSEAPSVTYEYYLNHIKPKPEAVGTTKDGQTVWRCKICGYEYVGEELPDDFICPLCKHPASDFEKVSS